MKTSLTSEAPPPGECHKTPRRPRHGRQFCGRAAGRLARPLCYGEIGSAGRPTELPSDISHLTPNITHQPFPDSPCPPSPATSSPSTRSGSPTTSSTCWSSAAASPGCGPRWLSIRGFRCWWSPRTELEESNSNYAQGGIAGVSIRRTASRITSRTRSSPAGGCAIARWSRWSSARRPQRIRELIEWGTQFDQADGELALGREGGHSHHRIVHALGDATGKEVMRAMIDRARERARRSDLAEHLHARPADARRPLPRRAGLEPTPRQDLRLGQADDPLHRRRGADLPRNDQSRRRHRRRPGHRLPRRRRADATWSSCSSIPRCCTSPAAAAA